MPYNHLQASLSLAHSVRVSEEDEDAVKAGRCVHKEDKTVATVGDLSRKSTLTLIIVYYYKIQNNQKSRPSRAELGKIHSIKETTVFEATHQEST